MQFQLPELYRSFFPKELLELDLQETKATCENCAMTRQNRGPQARLTYQAHLKCCTYEPYVPNFWVGALLKEADRFPLGAAHFRKKIQERGLALPIGILPDLEFQVIFNARKQGQFGNESSWICPYYDKQKNNCGIWKYRGSVCMTFFCQSDFGKSGLRFWKNFSDYLSYVEMTVMEEALVDLDFSPRQVSSYLEYMNVSKISPGMKVNFTATEYRKLWNGYADDIEGFYIKCYDLVSAFDRSRFQEALGQVGRKLQKKTTAQGLRLKKEI